MTKLSACIVHKNVGQSTFGSACFKQGRNLIRVADVQCAPIRPYPVDNHFVSRLIKCQDRADVNRHSCAETSECMSDCIADACTAAGDQNMPVRKQIILE